MQFHEEHESVEDSSIVCLSCQATIADGNAKFCPFCGTRLVDDAEDHVTIIRNRLGGKKETILRPREEHEASLEAQADPHDYVPAPGTTPGEVVVTQRRRRRRRKKPLYKRPLVMVPLTFVVVLVALGGSLIFRLESTVSTVQSISTVPPVVNDSTYLEDEDIAQEDVVPENVDTAPAVTAIANAQDTMSLPTSSDGGLSSRITNTISLTGDIAKSAASASGLSSGGDQAITLLVMGVDAREGSAIDIGVRPDAFMLVRLDPTTDSCRILSVPRDTRVELPGYGESKINHALMVGGIPYELLVAQTYLDLTIDHYVLIDFQAFETIVDTVGGITVTVPEDYSKNGEIRYTAGTYEFDGAETLAYARFRTTSDDGDYGRVRRQWSILSALVDATSDRSLVSEAQDLLPQIEDNMRTDMNPSEILDIVSQYGNTCRGTDADDIQMLQGTRVKLSDPILGQTAYFNVVTDSTKERIINEFLTGETTGDATGPASTPIPATPVPATPVPAGTPVPSGTPVTSITPQTRRRPIHFRDIG